MLINSLPDAQLINRIRDMVRSADIGIISTSFPRIPLPPMARSCEWDETGSLCFSNPSMAASGETMQHKKVKLFYCNPRTADYVSIYGDAEIEIAGKPSRNLWKSVRSFFSGSQDASPAMTIRRVKPTEAYLWDNSSNRMLSLFSSRTAEPLPKTVSNRLCGEVLV